MPQNKQTKLQEGPIAQPQINITHNETPEIVING